MIISHSNKFVFFRVSKTGSTTAEVMLRLSSAFDFDTDFITGTREWEFPPTALAEPFENHNEDGINYAHLTPTMCIDLGLLTLEQLREYKCYGFVRKPTSRFISGYMHMQRGDRSRWGRHGLQPQQYWERRLANAHPHMGGEIIGRAQVDWFFHEGEQVVTPLNFHDYQDELRFMIDEVGGYCPPEIPTLNNARYRDCTYNSNRREWAREVSEDPRVIQEVNEIYEADLAFYSENFPEVHQQTGTG